MKFVLVGFNYQTAPLALRERFYLADAPLRAALAELQQAGLAEVVILSTCNRLEIVACAEQFQPAVEVMKAFLARAGGMSDEQLAAYLYCLEGRAVVRHLMRVACGLESLILGETQILGQVAHALALAQAAHTDGTILSRLVTAALHAGKRARHETAISRHTLSVSHAAVSLIKRQVDNLSSLRALVIGAGEMGELAARALQMHGVSAIQIMNRTDARAFTLAQHLGIEAVSWAHFSVALAQVDAIIAATSAVQPLIWAEQVAALNVQRPLLIVDIGVPRNVDPQVAQVPNVRLYDIDDLRSVVSEHHSLRQSEIEAVEAIIAYEQTEFEEWLDEPSNRPLDR